LRNDACGSLAAAASPLSVDYAANFSTNFIGIAPSKLVGLASDIDELP
jgi:hypothetical protein